MNGFCRILLLLTMPVTMAAQTLAHPGWRGNGIASELWWKHAVFVRMPADSTFTAAAGTLDAMSQAGADSMILPELQPAGEPPSPMQPFLSTFGTEEELDTLLREAAARRMHVIVHGDVLRLANNSGEVRFWMSRGIAGFDVGDVSPANMGSLRLLRGSLDRFPGRRILLAHTPPMDRGSSDPVTLHLRPDAGVAGAVDVTLIDALKAPLPPGGTLIVSASLLTDEAARESIRRVAASQGRTSGRTYSTARSSAAVVGRSSARSGRRSRRHRSR